MSRRRLPSPAALLARWLAPPLPRRVREPVDDLGYVLGVDPLLEALPEAEWRAMERRATGTPAPPT